MVNLSKIRLDAAAEQSGRWATWKYGIRLLLGRMNTPKFQERMRTLSLPFVDAIRAETELGDAKIKAITIQVTAELVLLGWENIENDDNTPLEYSTDAAIALLSDPGLRDMYDFVLVTASDRERYLVEDAAKNLESALTGSETSESTKHD